MNLKRILKPVMTTARAESFAAGFSCMVFPFIPTFSLREKEQLSKPRLRSRNSLVVPALKQVFLLPKGEGKQRSAINIVNL